MLICLKGNICCCLLCAFLWLVPKRGRFFTKDAELRTNFLPKIQFPTYHYASFSVARQKEKSFPYKYRINLGIDGSIQLRHQFNSHTVPPTEFKPSTPPGDPKNSWVQVRIHSSGIWLVVDMVPTLIEYRKNTMSNEETC